MRRSAVFSGAPAIVSMAELYSLASLPFSSGELNMSHREREGESPTHEICTMKDLRKAKVGVLRQLLKITHKSLHSAAVRSDESIEHVHQLRVNSRRSLAAMDVFCSDLSDASSRWIVKRLKEFLKSAGKARDLDILLTVQLPRLGTVADRLGEYWTQQRQQCQQTLRKLDRRMRRDDRFSQEVKCLLKKLNRRASRSVGAEKDNDSAQDWVWQKIAIVAAEFTEAIPQTSTPDAMHQLRISGKRFRYTLELLAPLLPPNCLKSTLRQVKELQDRLGQVQDHVVAVEQLEELRFQQREVSDVAIVQTRVRHEYQQVLQSVSDFQEWLKSEELQRLRETVGRLIESAGKSTPA
jgi:CHAD domain-containing protein